MRDGIEEAFARLKFCTSGAKPEVALGFRSELTLALVAALEERRGMQDGPGICNMAAGRGRGGAQTGGNPRPRPVALAMLMFPSPRCNGSRRSNVPALRRRATPPPLRKLECKTDLSSPTHPNGSPKPLGTGIVAAVVEDEEHEDPKADALLMDGAEARPLQVAWALVA
eukprot:CAMPEP_0115169468 /NCGR_PEP_ID=MMETSP0270-20121206/1284_1 /TAXON_ID=71861 /ORGANISM="Scrippsiella trochoidea, Strain CCMP3099" /LENGTH=168 /DNA_ID=CAMNT_0002582167 /DNA_START=97 /DNA_END=604 /DNA_ORIENTATION=+